MATQIKEVPEDLGPVYRDYWVELHKITMVIILTKEAMVIIQIKEPVQAVGFYLGWAA